MSAKRADNSYVTRGEFRTFATSVDARFTAIDARFDASDATQRAMGVLLERIDSKITAIVEGQAAMEERLKREIRESEARLNARIDVLEAAVRQNTKDIQRLSVEVAELRARFDRREGTLEDHEARITDLEKRAGIRK